MRGCLQRAKKDKHGLPKGHHTWNIILARGRGPNGKHKQTWVRFHGTRPQADAKRAELVNDVSKGKFVDRSRLTVGEWLDEWVEKAAKPPLRTESTYRTYKIVIDKHLKPALGAHMLQRLMPLDVERYYAESKLSQRTLCVHRAVLTKALSAAVDSDVLIRNVAKRASNKPKLQPSEDSLHNVWSADEARKFLATVKQHESAQLAALFAVALDGGLRKAELLGLKWHDIDFPSGKLKVERQLLGWNERGLVTSLPKGKRARSLDLSPETMGLLNEHKRQQAELKMKNRLHYADHGLIIAQAWEQQSSRRSVLGAPWHRMAIDRQLERLCRTAGVKRISVHGLRHTCATLLLSAGVPANLVQRRLGHKNIAITLDIYSHVLPSMQQDAAKRLGSLLHG